MRKGDATRARILELALPEVAQRGLAAVSLGDLAARAELSKSCVLKHFETREGLSLAIVAEATDEFGRTVVAPTLAADQGRPRLEALFAAWMRWHDERWVASGCPLTVLAVELDDQPGPARDLLRARMAAFHGVGRSAFAALRAPPLSEAEARAAFFEMRSFFLGYADARRMMGDTDAQAFMRQAFAALLARTATPTA